MCLTLDVYLRCGEVFGPQCTHLAPRDEGHLAERDEYIAAPLKPREAPEWPNGDHQVGTVGPATGVARTRGLPGRGMLGVCAGIVKNSDAMSWRIVRPSGIL